MLSRPHSPFKRSSRSPLRSGSPIRGMSSAKWFTASSNDDSGNNEYHRMNANVEQNHLPTAPSAVFAGPSTSPGGSPSQAAINPHLHQLSRAEHYDVVIEGEHGEAILTHLGGIVLDQSGGIEGSDAASKLSRSSSGSSITAIPTSRIPEKEKSAASSTKFESMLHELVQTEKSYVRRIEVLYQRYAVPLRQMARDRDTAIIPLYESQRLFGNIGEILGANMAFLRELEIYLSDRVKGKIEEGGCELGDIIYRNIACFSCYNEYFNNFEKAKHIEQSMMRNNRGFRDFIDRTKYSITGMGNIGLRELIMEPVQRIPRYTMLFDGLIRNLPTTDPNRARLEQAVVLAGRIASCEVDDKTKRAAVLWSFSRNVDGFPAGLISVHRQYIDCIDVDDFPIDVLGPSAMNTLLSPGTNTASGYRTIHCTLFLFDDVIAIAKRASSASCGRSLVGLDDLSKLADQMKTYTERSAIIKSPAKVELGFRGLIDVSEVRAIDMGGPDFQMLFMRPPSHISGDKWAGRAVRQYATVDAQSTQGPDPAFARQEKARFLDNLWRSQALFKAREHRSHVRALTVPSTSNEDKIRRVIYWNVYARRSYLAETHKSEVVLHVNLDGEADGLPFGHEEAPPSASVRIHSLDEDTAFCTYTASYKSVCSVADAGELHQVPLHSLSDEMFRTSKQLNRNALDGFDPRHGSPTTPGSSHRSGRALASGLEQFGRSLFGTPSSIRSAATGSDFFGVKRTRSKGSSQYTRNTSVSTRKTYSTAHTSSVGSRDMLQYSVNGRSDIRNGNGSPGTPVNDLQANIERYRNMSPRSNAEMATPTRHETSVLSSDASLRSSSHSPNGREGANSPVRRKPVPQSDRTPIRVPSGSKRELPVDATPTAKPAKRIAHGRDSVNGDTANDESISAPPSPSPTNYASAPQTPVRKDDINGNNKLGSVKPLSIRKDRGQQRQLNRSELMHKIQRDLDTLQRAYENTQSILANARNDMSSGRDAIVQIDDCFTELESTDETIQRLRKLMKECNQIETVLPQPATLIQPIISDEWKAEEIQKLQAQLANVERKCELLVSLERDGRLENTELHKAFNEELDRMYDDIQLPSVDEQVVKLRTEIRQAKSQRNEANLEKKALQRELALEKAQSEVWRATLIKHGLI